AANPQPNATTAAPAGFGPDAQRTTCAALLAEADAAQRSGDHRGGVQKAEAALAACLPGDDVLRAKALCLLAMHRWRLGQFEQAITATRDALPLLEREDRETAARCEALCLMAVSYSELGLQEEALKQALMAFDLARERGDRLWMAWALNRIGICYERLGDPAQGERFLLQALDESLSLNDADIKFTSLNNLMAAMVGAYHLHRRRRDAEGEANAHSALQRARLYGHEAMTLARHVGDRYREAVTIGNLGEVLGLSGESEAAFKLLDKALVIAHTEGYRALELRTLHSIGEVSGLCGAHQRAVDLLEPALSKISMGEHETTRMRMHSALHRSYKALQRYREALEHHEAFYALESRRAALQHQAQARLMVNRIEVEQALMQGERSRLEAERERLKTQQLEAEKRKLEASTEELHRHALEDQLTGLANRRRVDHDLPELFGRARESGKPLSVAVADLDNFKTINDEHGHLLGDEVLRAVAQIFRANTRGSDVLARFGGEEFLLLFVDTPLDIAQEVCERLRLAIETYPWQRLAPDLGVTISLGLCDATPDPDPTRMLARADGALYYAKRTGRNRVSVDDPPGSSSGFGGLGPPESQHKH
ncbi:MAG TPA: diguanylate cyclase, partial [Methylibium sp.]